MNVLIACEESQTVCKAFRARGFNAFSCDIQDCSGGHPEWHIKGDVLPLLNGDISFTTVVGCDVTISGKWDLIIAHPPCTYLTVSGNRWFDVQQYGDAARQRFKERYKAIVFFMQMALAWCDHVAVENPVGIIGSAWKSADQVIQPWQFGHPYTKSTCLWLKGLPPLEPTNILEKPLTGWENQHITKDGRYGGYGSKWGCNADGKWLRYGDPRVAKERSKTFPGIAEAMAEQWGDYLIKERTNEPTRTITNRTI